MEANSLHYRSFAEKTIPKDASFSSYLRPQELKPVSQDDAGSAGGSALDDYSELSIFQAQKYFNENNDHPRKESKMIGLPPPAVKGVNLPVHNGYEQFDRSEVLRLSSVSLVNDLYSSSSKNYRVRSFRATPTASSEASWNSQTGLLSNPPGSIPVSLTRNLPNSDQHQKKREYSRVAKWFFCRKCPCVSKKSVKVEEATSDSPRTPASLDEHVRNSSGILCAKRQSPKMMKVGKVSSCRSLQQNSDTIDIIKKSQDKVAIANSSNFQSEVIIRNSLKFQCEEEYNDPFDSSNITTVPCHQRIQGPPPERPFSDGFSFPILNHQSSQVKLILKGLPPQQPSTSSLEDPPRDSLEVFQPLDELIPRKYSTLSRVTATDDDVASDASSDLFEIESFSTSQTTTSYPIQLNMYGRRNSLDDAPTFNARRAAAAGNIYQSLDSEPATPSIATATTEYCYDPSEASIDWSVTTAEGFDRASVTNLSVTASEIEDVGLIMRHHSLEKIGGIVYNRGGRETDMEVGIKRKGNGLLLSCRDERAVNVGPHPVKFMAEEAPSTTPFPSLISSKLGHVSSRPPNPNKPSVARPPSARLSLAFAT